jgi:predicted 3-demethylubiquinone-9 3-methyltransferase (glyoxalase superfamily)
MASMQKITPNLWFDNQAEEAVNFYLSVFPQSSKGKTSRYGKEGFETHHMPEGTVMVMEFQLCGQSFTALNGGPIFKFNEAVSFIINCESQEEIDQYWNKLIEGGDKKAQVCGWLKDKFGVSWQVVPAKLAELLSSGDASKSQRVMHALMQMKKLDLGKLEEAYNG